LRALPGAVILRFVNFDGMQRGRRATGREHEKNVVLSHCINFLDPFPRNPITILRQVRLPLGLDVSVLRSQFLIFFFGCCTRFGALRHCVTAQFGPRRASTLICTRCQNHAAEDPDAKDRPPQMRRMPNTKTFLQPPVPLSIRTSLARIGAAAKRCWPNTLLTRAVKCAWRTDGVTLTYFPPQLPVPPHPESKANHAGNVVCERGTGACHRRHLLLHRPQYHGDVAVFEVWTSAAGRTGTGDQHGQRYKLNGPRGGDTDVLNGVAAAWTVVWTRRWIL